MVHLQKGGIIHQTEILHFRKFNMASFQVSFIIMLSLVGFSQSLSCYYCSRLTVSDSGSADTSAVNAALDAALSNSNEPKCKAGMLDESLATTADGKESCSVLKATLTFDFNGETITVEGQNSADSTVGDELACYDSSSDEFDDAVKPLIQTLDNQASIQSSAATGGDYCRCSTDKCNTDTDSLEAQLTTTTTTTTEATTAMAAKVAHSSLVLSAAMLVFTILGRMVLMG